MLWMTPGMLVGNSEAGPTHAMRSSCDRIAALLQTSEPVQSRPMFVSKRTVTAHPAVTCCAPRNTGQPCGLSHTERRIQRERWRLPGDPEHEHTFIRPA